MIILAIENNNVVYAYNERKEVCLQINGKLHSYTCYNVAIKQNKCVYIYDENSTKIAEYPKDFIDVSNIAGVIL